MTTKKSIKITISMLVLVIIAGVVLTIGLLSNNAFAMPMFASAYKTSGITGITVASYKVGNCETEFMESASGEKFLSFTENDGEEMQYLSPVNQIVLTEQNNYVVFTYKFVNSGKSAFVATMVYEDVNNDDKNISVSYLSGESSVADAQVFANWNEESSNKCVVVNAGAEVTCSIKVKVENLAKDATFSGNFDWTLSL